MQIIDMEAKVESRPYAGVWIEINKDIVETLGKMSLPTRECGLK